MVFLLGFTWNNLLYCSLPRHFELPTVKLLMYLFRDFDLLFPNIFTFENYFEMWLTKVKKYIKKKKKYQNQQQNNERHRKVFDIKMEFNFVSLKRKNEMKY